MKVYKEAEVQHHSFSGYLQIKDYLSYAIRTEVHIIIINNNNNNSKALGGPWPPRSTYTKINSKLATFIDFTVFNHMFYVAKIPFTLLIICIVT